MMLALLKILFLTCAAVAAMAVTVVVVAYMVAFVRDTLPFGKVE